MTSPRRTEFAPLVLDLIDFIEEKINEALEDETSRPGAVADAAGAVSPLRGRLRENEVATARFMLVADVQFYGPAASRWWTEFAGMDRQQFETRAADLKGLFPTLRQIVRSAIAPIKT